MPEYLYQAKQGPEKLIEGVIEAPTETAAIEKISRQGYVPVKISVYDKSKTGKQVRQISRQNPSKMFLFTSHLSRLVKSGVPILRAIHLMAAAEKNPSMSSMLVGLEKNLREGKSLSKAMETCSVFSAMYVAVVRAGELSGSLPLALSRMAAYFKKQAALSSKIRRAMAYPAVLVIAGILSIFFIMMFLVPRLEKVFVGIGQDLPLPTRIVLEAGSFMQHFWYIVVGAIVLFSILIPMVFKRFFGKSAVDLALLSLPFLGELIKKIEFSQFSRILSFCFASGLPFLESVRVAIPAINNDVIRKAFEHCALQVEKGSSFGQALKQERLFPEVMVSLISIGEEAGKVEETLTEIADIYEEDADEFLLYATTFLEPFMILFIGGIIGFIVMAVLLPIFQMNAVF